MVFMRPKQTSTQTVGQLLTEGGEKTALSWQLQKTLNPPLSTGAKVKQSTGKTFSYRHAERDCKSEALQTVHGDKNEILCGNFSPDFFLRLAMAVLSTTRSHCD